ncbi:indolepyruvate ferredoxin oxidoreductase family protein [Nocardioides carbamazepini]|uniref:indolepyruvate ferredoxin oxidoreductase family protein n=1 Tax=Nocardioides carbamazepini TaxID=2854259 RepID=UPI002149ED4B|nr:indolepyruvate ferredoxin oxidoreductase family protein [Nocardioides carbamazepini]MCR1781329.1 indolepyruvate ferredoxin oxidoreductase family protein [Nocardioides carbamazepini]
MTLDERRRLTLSDRYEKEAGEVYLSGLQALVRIPLDQHRLDAAQGRSVRTLISGYEGSPLAGYDLEIARRSALLEAAGVVFRPSVNEELAANAVQGSQLASASPDRSADGVVGIWYGKAPGLDRATDALRHGNLGGADPRGGVLVLVGDDSIAKSSTVPSASEVAMAEIGLPVLAPADPQDVLDLGLHGIALSRFCGLWTGLKLATNVVDGAASARVSPGRVVPVTPSREIAGAEFAHEVSAHFLQPQLGRLEQTLMNERVELARRYAAANGLNVISGDGDARVGVIAGGATYLDVCQALTLLGLDPARLEGTGVRLLKLGMISPLEPGIIEEFCRDLDEVVVVEEKRSFIEAAVKDQLYGSVGAPSVSGRRTPDGRELFRSYGDLPPDLIAERLGPRLPGGPGRLSVAGEPTRRLLPMVSRTPYFCSGCPHNRSTEVPDGSLVGAGIGCSALAALMPAERVGNVIGFTQMGGEGGSWIGMAPFVKQQHLIQNVGDGTFHHSASLAVRAAVASGVRMTYKILYNDAVAMTGGQEAVGKMTVSALVRSLAAEGVSRTVITTDAPKKYRRVRLPRGVTVAHRDRLTAVQEELAQVDGVTVIVHDQECATELRRKRKRNLAPDSELRVMINERVCEGCGDCGVKSNCLSVQPVDTEFGRKTRIHQASCNGDVSCLDGDCPSFIAIKPGKRSTARARRGADVPVDALPDPRLRVPVDRFNLRITGVGGTGVVTIAQVIATAASIEGRYVRSLDQLGMAQKGGAVVSDVRMGLTAFQGANKVDPGECDLYLGCDLLVAASDANLAVLSPERSIAVVSTSNVPTGQMVTDPSVTYPEVGSTVERVLGGSRREHAVTVDAREAVLALLGDDQYANVFLVGAAVQAGALPIAPAILEEALALNDVAVDRNLQAFRWGRWYVADPNVVRRAMASAGPRPVDGQAAVPSTDPDEDDVARLVAARVGDLTAYQDEDYAARYAREVGIVARAEREALGSIGGLSYSYARHLYKLMAYKDEYEVARLSLDPAVDQAVRDAFGEDARYWYRLHPPILRALGMKRKIAVGPWFRVVFRGLYALRWLRGTAFDPFGRGEVRAVERALAGEYRDLVERSVERLEPATAKTVQALVDLPDAVRGYEQIKLDSIRGFRAAAAALERQLSEQADQVGR